MLIRILGSAAGGGVPQWNCRCANCAAARAGFPYVRPRTQSSVAVSADGCSWYLLNVSPDIRQHILAFPPLGPPDAAERGQGIAGCILTDAELDHTLGLLLLREGAPFSIFATTVVRQWLQQSLPIERLLACFAKPDWVNVTGEQPVLLRGRGADCQSALGPQAGWQRAPRSGGLVLRVFALGRHVPRFVAVEVDEAFGHVIGLLLEDARTGGKLFYAPCVEAIDDKLISIAGEADVILIDGTFWSDEEPLLFGKRTAIQMGHIPASGPQGSLTWLADLPARHRVYVHINNTNPMLNENGPELQQPSGAASLL